MTFIVQLTIIILGCVLFLAILLAAIQKKITEAHALLWIVPCIFIILGGIFPQLTYCLSHLFHTEYPPSIIFAFAIIMAYLILFQCFKSLSVLTMKNKELASQNALMEKQLEELKKEIHHMKKDETLS